MTMTKDTVKADLQKLLQNMNKANEEAENALQEIDRKIAAIDLRYAKMLVREEIDTLETAKKILENKAVG